MFLGSIRINVVEGIVTFNNPTSVVPVHESQ
jgi:hypothetical protein